MQYLNGKPVNVGDLVGVIVQARVVAAAYEGDPPAAGQPDNRPVLLQVIETSADTSHTMLAAETLPWDDAAFVATAQLVEKLPTETLTPVPPQAS